MVYSLPLHEAQRPRLGLDAAAVEFLPERS